MKMFRNGIQILAVSFLVFLVFDIVLLLMFGSSTKQWIDGLPGRPVKGIDSFNPPPYRNDYTRLETVSNNTRITERCIKYFLLLTARVGTWPEYSVLENAFQEAKSHGNESSSVFIECPDFKCDIAMAPLPSTYNTSLLEHNDALFINFGPKLNRDITHTFLEQEIKSLPHHLKIFFYAMESPLMLNYFDQTIDDIQYHYDMTYDSESDVYHPYGRFIPGEPTDTREINYAENKTDLLVWVGTNCQNTFWPRMEWIRNLEKILTFDTYGKCGKKVTCLPRMSVECARQNSKYKFTLALENAPCNGYVTEKFWLNGLMSGVVPIVYGGTRESYERVAPPNSFIHIGDFSSQQEVVDFIQIVDKNDSLYNEFFAWRKQGRVEKVYPKLQPQSFCRVLPRLSESTSTPVKHIRDSKFFQRCRGGSHREFTVEGDINNWAPWK